MTQSRLQAHDLVIQAQIKEGKSQAAIARELGVPISTLKSYVQNRHMLVATANDKTNVAKAAPTLSVNVEDMLRAEVRELKSALSAGHKTNVAQERIINAVESAVVVAKPPARLRVSPLSSSPGMGAHHRQVLVLSDFHGGEIVDPEAVNGLNDYNWQIMEERVDQLLAGLESHRRKSPDLTGIDVLFVGDMCSGANHQELAETNQFPLAEQGVKMGYLQGRIVEHVSALYEDVRVLVIAGNHPRLKVKPAAKRVHDNMDWVAGLVAKQFTSSLENVSWTIPAAGAAFWQVAGLTYYVFHGDGIRSSMPGVPWGGVMRRTNEIRRAHSGRHIDGFILGHFHQANAMLDIGIFMNGALKGTDEWVLKNMGGGGRPTQLLLTFDEDKERLTDVRMLTPTAGVPS